MERIDNALKQDLLKHGIEIRQTTTNATIIKTLLRDLSQFKEQSKDAGDLIRRNTELAQQAMHWKIQFEEQQAELESLKRAVADDKKVYEEHVAFLEKTIPQIGNLPKSKVLQQVWGTDIAKDTLNLLHYADRLLHELEDTNRRLNQELDKQFMRTTVFLSKIKVRDNELQRLTNLISGDRWHSTSSKSEGRNCNQMKLLQEKNIELERMVQHLRAVQKVPLSMPDHELRKELQLAETKLKELADQMRHLNSKNTSLQGIVSRYAYELKIARLERDNFFRQLQEQQDKSLVRSNAVVDSETRVGSQDSQVEPTHSSAPEPRNRSVPLDENGNDANYRTKEHQTVIQTKKTFAKNGGDFESSMNDKLQNRKVVDSKILEKVAQYEVMFTKLSDELRTFKDAIRKKDAEICSLRTQTATLASAHEENARLHEDLGRLQAKSRDFKVEIQRLRRQIQEYTTEAATAAKLAVNTTGEKNTVGQGTSERSNLSQQQTASTQTSSEQRPEYANPTETSRNQLQSDELPTEAGVATNTNPGFIASQKEQDRRFDDNFYLLKHNVAELNARLSLETEKRKQAELRLQRIERIHQFQQERQQPPSEQPSKKFKASIHIHQINGEIELDPEKA